MLIFKCLIILTFQQMLVVQNRIDNEDGISRNKNFNIEEFIWPHGITPPLHYVRKRRFRKRVNKRVSSFRLLNLCLPFILRALDD